MTLKEKTEIIKKINKLDYIENAVGKKLVHNVNFNLLKWFILRKQPMNYFRAGSTFLEKGVPIKAVSPSTLPDNSFIMESDGSIYVMKFNESGNRILDTSGDIIESLGSGTLFMPCDFEGKLFEDNINVDAKALKDTLNSYEFSIEDMHLYHKLHEILDELLRATFITNLSEHLQGGGLIKRLKNGLTIKLSDNQEIFMSKTEEGWKPVILSPADILANDWIKLKEEVKESK